MVAGSLRLALIAGGGLLLLALLPFFVPEAWLRRSLAGWAQAQWQRTLEIDSLRLQLLPAPSLRARQIRLSNPSGFDHSAEPFLRVARLRVNFSWYQLLWQRSLQPQQLQFTAPHFHLLVSDGGAANWRFARAPQTHAVPLARAALLPAAALGTLRVHMQDALLTYHKAGEPRRRLRLDALSARLTRKQDGLEILLHPLRLYEGELSLHAARRSVAFSGGGGQATAGSGGGGQATAADDSGGGATANWQGALNWERLALGPLFADWGFPRIAGRMSGRMDFTGSSLPLAEFGRSFRAEGDLRVEDGAFLGLDLARVWRMPGLATVLAFSNQARSQFAIPQTAFSIREGALHTSELRLDNAEGPALLGEGRYEFANQEWRFILRRPDSPDSLVLSGTPNKPKLSWQVEKELQHLRKRAAQDVLDQLVEELF